MVWVESGDRASLADLYHWCDGANSLNFLQRSFPPRVGGVGEVVVGLEAGWSQGCLYSRSVVTRVK